jgi:hypothetical protein
MAVPQRSVEGTFLTILTLVEAAGPGNRVKAAKRGRRVFHLHSGKSLTAVSRKGARDVSCPSPHCSPRCHMRNAEFAGFPLRTPPQGSCDALVRSRAVSGKRRQDCFKTDGQRYERWQARSTPRGATLFLEGAYYCRWGIHGSLISRLPLIFSSSPGDRMVPVNVVVSLRLG